MKLKHFLFSAAVAVASFAAVAQGSDGLDPNQKVRRAEAIIETFYVDDVDGDTLVTEAIRAMLRTLDPHSAYSTPEETREFNEPLEGSFSGIGIQFNILEDTVYVIQPTAGGPSERVGILPGDRIVECNDTVIAGVNMSKRDIMRRLRGPKGTTARLMVRRQGEDIVFNVVRDDIPIYSVDESFMADPNTGYIRITRFAEGTADEVAIAMNKLRRQGMKNLIIDLSDNGGGYLGAAFELAGHFLPSGTPVVSTAGRRVRKQQYETTSEGDFQEGRVVVIANQYSASASEIFAGAMQDNDRGLIVGRRTFGKGLVQRPFPFPDGSMMRLTVSRYYTPSGRCIQKHYDKGHSEDYQREVYLRMTAGELWNADSIARPDSLMYRTLRNNRPVYGGGGIIPDVFVPADTSYYSRYYRDIVAKNVLNRTVINYVEHNRADLLRRYSNNDKFYKNYEIPQSLVNDLIARATADSIQFDQAQWDRSCPIIKGVMKGLISRDLYESGSYYRAIAPLNKDFSEALRLINDPERYNRLLSGEILPGDDRAPIPEAAVAGTTGTSADAGSTAESGPVAEDSDMELAEPTE